MKNARNFIAHVSALILRALDGLRALRKDAELARHASTRAELPRRSQSELRALYLAPGEPPPAEASAPSAARVGSASHRAHGHGHRSLTPLAVCAVLVVVVAIALPHSG